jgi:hypothetical protein
MPELLIPVVAQWKKFEEVPVVLPFCSHRGHRRGFANAAEGVGVLTVRSVSGFALLVTLCEKCGSEFDRRGH